MNTNSNSIAIIGMTGRFPGAGNVDEFWNNLIAGVESVSFFSDQELTESGLNAAEIRKNPNFVAARGILKDPEWFDAAFFGFSAKEAEVMDPQQRLFIEASWEALEDAGYDPARVKGYVGVFAGMGSGSYYNNNLHSRPDVTRLVGDMAVSLGNEKDFIATRVAYKLNLRGPAISTHAACSTSLVTVCQACHALLGYQCDIALAGGVSVSFPQKRASYYQEGGIFSSDGHCRPFDAQATGTYFSDGLGVVVLKRLAEALNDGDRIYAVIKGVGINNDGATKVGFTAPSVRGQAEVVALALAHAEVEPDTISYVETHGTATPLGDPIEIAALTQAFQAGTSRKNFCAIGSVKSNIGHLVAAAGVTGLIKTALALKHKKLPSSLNFSRPNPKIDFAASPFYVNSKSVEWQDGPTPRRAGVSSFGIGGTNAHVVLEEAPPVEPSGPSRPWQLLPLSAKTRPALDAATANLLRHFKATPNLNLADAAFTLQQGRQIFEHRQILVCRDLDDAEAALASRDPKRIITGAGSIDSPSVVFMFPGQGAQYVNMGADLYREEAVFKQEIDRCAELLLPALELDLRQVLYPAAEKTAAAEELLLQTRLTQPALFVISYAMARLWMSWGIQPAAMIGHSVGEYVAGCLAGVFSLPDALKIVAGRAKLVQAQPRGSMLAIRLPQAEVAPHLTGALAMAAINSPKMCVVSGPTPAIDRLDAYMTEQRVPTKRLPTSHAFHSAMMDPVVAPLMELLRSVKLKEPSIPYVSNVTGKWITGKEARDPGYWTQHVRQTVLFADGLAELAKQTGSVLLEVGPGQSLSAFARQHPASPSGQLILSSFSVSQEDEQTAMLSALGRLWIAGVAVDWNGFYQQERRQRIALPTYPFERKRYWVEPGTAVSSAVSKPASQEHDQPVAILSAAASTSQTPMSRQDQILAEVTAQFKDLSGASLEDLQPSARFTELGFDSLFLAQASHVIQQKFGIPITFRRLLDDLSTLKDVASFLNRQLPAAEPDGAPPQTPPQDAPQSATLTLPLTEPQQEVWLASQADEDASRAFNQVFAIHLSGQIEPDALAGIVQQLVDRHDALRTTFAPDGSIQKISPTMKVELPLLDLSAHNESEQERQITQVKAQEDQTLFDLVNGPLFRARLLKLSGGRLVLIMAAHHIVFDGWSMGVLLREFSQLCEARHGGEAAHLESSMQYREFIEWHNSEQYHAAAKNSEAYWLERFSTIPTNLELPADRPRPSVKTYRAAERELLLDSPCYQSLKQAAAAHDCTLFSLLMAGLNAWLFRLTGQEDIVIGVPAAGQLAAGDHPGSRWLVGHCVNSLPLRSHCDGNARFADHLLAVKSLVLDAYEHQHFTLASLVRKLHLRTDPSRSPLVTLMFNLGRASRMLRLAGARFTATQKAFNFFDLNIEAHDSGQDLHLVCRYNTDLFDDARVGQMLNQLQTLLKAAVANPDLKVADLPLLTEEERRQILVEWNRTDFPYPKDRCLHELIEEQVERAPDAVAVSFEGQTLTYRELNSRANQLARHLQRMGVGPDSLVGICAERSLEMVIGLLGILKAGGAYVPMDPEYPKERLAFMLEDSAVKVLLTQSRLEASIPSSAAQIVPLDALWARITGESTDNLRGATIAQNLAYMIYTSGSTGQPKGAMNTHQGIVNRLLWMQDEYRLAPPDRVLQKTPFSFDVSVWEFFWPLLTGARLVVARPGGHRDGAYMAQLIAQEKITTIHFVPSMLQAFLEQDGLSVSCSSLKRVICSGEALPTEFQRRFFSIFGAELHNLYGPTEASVDVTYWACQRESKLNTVPIGRPIANTRIYILDPRLQPVPMGVPGELHIGGIGLARGYHNRPELTKEKFIPNPFEAGTRLYKTGDLARFRSDGAIEYLGRLDHQVKIRGFRIELGEIESLLNKHSAVQESAVAVRQEAGGQKRLIGYVVCKNGNATEGNLPETLKSFLLSKLPEYMVPATIEILPALPHLPNGKVDRKSLPEPSTLPASNRNACVAPRNQKEQALADIWKQVLLLDKVGVMDDFLELGGDSLLSFRVANRATQAGIRLTPRLILEHKTIAALVKALESGPIGAAQAPVLTKASRRAVTADLLE